MAYELPEQYVQRVTFMIRRNREGRVINQLHYCEESITVESGCLSTAGGDESLDEMFGKCMPRLFRVADCVLHNCHDSEDALQDGLLSALRHLDQFKGTAQFSTWLFSIVRNSALAKLRKQRAHSFVSIDDQASEDEVDLGWSEIAADPGPDPERACAQGELSSRFARTFEDLPANYRVIIRMCDFEGYSGREVAERLGLSVSALKAQHHRARRALRESMIEHNARKGG